MEAADDWFIGQTRGLPRRRRLEEILLDRRLRGLDLQAHVDHLDRLEQEVTDLKARLGSSEHEPPAGHVLFFPTPNGYAVVEADEPPPPVGRLLRLDDGCFRVQRLGRSPFPRDRRPCLFLEAEPNGI